MPVRLKTTYHGSRDNNEGQIFLHFAADASQLLEVAKSLKLAGVQCVLLVRWEGAELQELGVFMGNGMTQRPGKDYTLHYRSDNISIHSDVLTALRLACAGADEEHQQVFDLVVLTREEVEQQLADDLSGQGENDAAETLSV